MKTTLTTLTLRVLLLFPVFTLLSFVPGANTLLVIVSFALIVALILKKGISKKNFWLLFITLISTAWNLFVTGLQIINANEVIYLGYMCAFFVLITDNKLQVKQYFQKDIRYIKWICIIWNVFVLVSLPLKSSYRDGVFISFAGDTFRLSPSALFIMTLTTILIVLKGRKNIIYSIIPMLSILIGSSRTYLLLSALCMTINLYYVIKNRKYYLGVLGIMTALCVMVVLDSSMGQKIIDSFRTSTYRSQLSIFTNGRAVFWLRDLEAYLDQSTSKLLFGCGYNFIRIVNGAVLGTSERGLWAHNDFLQVLITNGLAGFLVYCYAIRKMFKCCLQKSLPKLMRAALVFIWFFNAFFNMYYTYMCAMLSLPILLIACEHGYANKANAEELLEGIKKRRRT